MRKYLYITLAIIFCVSALTVSAEKFYPIILSFNAGELSPKVDVRSDLDKYGSGARTMENFIPLVEGGVTRMPGTYFVFETKDSSTASRLIPFHFSTVQSYVIEMGDEYARFYKDDGLIATADSYTKLLLHCDGTDASTTFTDSGYTGHSPSAAGDAQVDTAQYEFETGSMYLDGTGDYVSVADHADWFMDTSSFTIDFWVRPENLSSVQGIFQQRFDDSNIVFLEIYENEIGFYIIDAGVLNFGHITVGGDYFSNNTWTHVAIVRDTSTWYYFINGVQIFTTTDSDDWPDINGAFEIGRKTYGGSSYYFQGWIDEFRVSKGIARWTENFTPPTQEYPFATTGNLTGGGYSAYEITTPYAAEDLFDIKTVQSADVLYLFHPDYPPKKLTRTAHTSWTLTGLETQTGDFMQAYLITKADPAVLYAHTVPTTLAAGDIVYVSGVEGMTEINDQFSTVASVTTGDNGHFELSDIDSSGYSTYTNGTGGGYENVFGTTDNDPSCGTFFEQRLVMASTNNYPQKLWGSVNGSYYDFNEGTDDDDALSYTIVSNKVDRIRWMVPTDYLMVGTIGGVWRVGATTTGEPLSPTNIAAKKQITAGVADIQAQQVSDAVLYVTRSGFSVKQLSYSFELDKYIAPDMTRIAKHITYGDTLAESGIKEIDFQSEPLPIFWAIRNDGQLLGMTYEIQEQVYAWFRVVTDGDFESIAVISRENQEDQVWVIVNRTINGLTYRYVEYFKPINFYSELTDAFFVHSGLTWEGTALSTITGISQTDPVVVTASEGHGINIGDKLAFYNTGTWLDTHNAFATIVNGNDITLSDEEGVSSIDGTGFSEYVYPATETTYTYTGSSHNIVYIQQSDPVKIFIPGHDLTAAQPVRIASVEGMTEMNGDHIVLGTTEDSITIDEDATAYTAYTSGGTVTGGSGTTTDGTIQTVIQTINGLDHLSWKVPAILADGAVHAYSESVTEGSITLDYYANKVHVGLPYDSILEPMKIYANVEGGTTRGQKQKINKLTIAFYESYGGQAGRDADNLNDIPFGTGGVPELVTDDIDFEFPGDWKDEATIYIIQDDPLPMTILGLMPRYNVSRD